MNDQDTYSDSNQTIHEDHDYMKHDYNINEQDISEEDTDTEYE